MPLMIVSSDHTMCAYTEAIELIVAPGTALFNASPLFEDERFRTGDERVLLTLDFELEELGFH